MRWIDLLRMSSSNLRRRKLRSILTILGVVIGTASIVVMISLGLGMQQSLYREIEQSGGMTAVTVTGKDVGSQMYYYSDSGSDQEASKYVTDETIEKLSKLEHVKSTSPVLLMNSIIMTGKYYGNIQLTGMTPEALKEQNISLVEGGTLPKTDGSELELVFGNLATENLMEKGTDKGYWETGVMPDVDVMKAQMFLILDSDAYYNSLYNTGNTAISTETSSSASTGGTTPTKAPKKYVVHASGRVKGDENTYNAHSYNVYCDITTLKNMLKKEYAGRAIPGQPTTKSGKPYKFFAYTNATVQVDDIDNVDAVASEIQNLGYKVTTNAEYVKSMQKQFAMIQAVLGGIGAVSLFVAAIGIMNTMMMSIYERTKEIGVIKVLGCSLKNIKQMFLLEAAFIGFIGGVVGNLLSFLMSFIINILTGNGSAMGLDGNISYIPPWLVIASMTFAMLIGMVAGYFPALRAMKLSPLAAIRNE